VASLEIAIRCLEKDQRAAAAPRAAAKGRGAPRTRLSVLNP